MTPFKKMIAVLCAAITVAFGAPAPAQAAPVMSIKVAHAPHWCDIVQGWFYADLTVSSPTSNTQHFTVVAISVATWGGKSPLLGEGFPRTLKPGQGPAHFYMGLPIQQPAGLVTFKIKWANGHVSTVRRGVDLRPAAPRRCSDGLA